MFDIDPKLKTEAEDRFRKNPRCGTCLKHIERGKEHPISYIDVRNAPYRLKCFCSGWCCHLWARMGGLE